MFDFLRHITRPADEKRREQLNAYVDGALPPRQRADFEQELAGDEALRAEVAQLRAVRAQLRALPRRRVPRQFTLDPAVYGRPQREPLVRAYPALRLATAMTAFFFILTVALQLFTSSAGMPLAAGAVSQVESTRIVSEMAAEAETAELAAPFDAQPAAEVPAEVDVQMEEAAEEEAAEVFEEMETAAAEDEAAAAEADAAAPEPRVVETPAPLGTATAAAPQAGVAAAPPAEATSALTTATPTE
ncbi:MAG: hypothetical protein KC425_06650, partial [Anaerolineales bacterium]|nr:hypothetical protein [Anaerolineales bacterium]